MIADDPSQWRRYDHEPTERTRRLAEKLAMLRVPREDIARRLDIGLATLIEHYREELERGGATGFSVADALWQNAIDKKEVVQVFWMKARHGWASREDRAAPNEGGST